ALGAAWGVPASLGVVGRLRPRHGPGGLGMAERQLRHGQGALWGGARGPNLTDRAKPCTKRSVLTEGHGWPLATRIAGANVHDARMLQDTLGAVVVEPPGPARHRQHLCLA